MELNRSHIQKLIRKLILLCLPLLAVPCGFSASSAAYRDSFVQGLASYKKGEWNDASIYLRQSVKSSEFATDSNWYMIIMSEVYSGNFDAAINDSHYFIDVYPDSQLISFVEYQRGRAYHSVGLNDNSVMALSSFCNEYPESTMYSSALYWIAECFYDDYDFDTARALYERILSEFPESSKKSDAEFKLYLITQHDREQKLLYLLKMTGEEYLNSREHYEKQLRMIQTDDDTELRKQLRAANSRIQELESGTPSETKVSYEEGGEGEYLMDSVTGSGSAGGTSRPDEEVLSLKAKAALIQRLLNERNTKEAK